MLAGDLPLEAVDRRELWRVEPRKPFVLLPKGVMTLLDQELRSSREANPCTGDATQKGDGRAPLDPSGGVRSSSVMGEAVEIDVNDVGRSIAEVTGMSSSGLLRKPS